MERVSTRHASPWLELVLALLLGAGYLAVCVWWTLRELMISIAANKVTASVAYGQVLGPVLTGRLIWFGIALLVAHGLLGLLALGLTRLTMAAMPEFAAPRRYRLVVGWFIALAGAVWIANVSWFPASRFAPDRSWLLWNWNGLRPAHVVFAALLLAVTALIARAISRPVRWPRTATFASASAALVITAALLTFGVSDASRPAAAYAKPHVVILGVDSLRDDLAGHGSGDPLTPHIDQVLSGAHRFSDTVSPLARTFPALVALLTGRHPVSSNARFNLMPRAAVHGRDTLGDALRGQGYRTVYATDEVRFANFDESYGFDQLIMPPVGASDFLLGKAGDLPLANLLSATRIGAWLFPSAHANRAVHVTYQPDDFVAKLDRELVVDRPSLLFIHLTLSHWPYSWAGQVTPTTPQEYRPAYRRAVAEVDRQFGDVWRMLERKGVLENAIVVVLSDHGEALGGPTDSMLRKTGTGPDIWNSLWGHGTSVMSPHQYSVLLAIRGIGRAVLPGKPGVHAWPVSLEDVRPTLQELVTGTAPTDVDGSSLVPFLADPESAATLATRIRYTETDFNTPMVLAGKYNESGLIHEGAAYYEVVPETGWVQLRHGRLPELLSKKQRAALSQDSLLAAIPSWTDDSVSFLFTDRHSPLPRRLQGRPDPAAEPEAARLWDALHARFPGELPEGSRLP
jgi:arylsulfatase A-like enzyme